MNINYFPPTFLKQKAPFILLFLFAFYGAFEWATLFPFYPIADFAGDMLTANKIKDEGFLLVGHWSTWGFNHPGSFWLYYNHFIENVLSIFPLNRLQMWRWGANLISASFIFYSALILSQYYLKKIDWFYAFIFIFLFCHFVDQAGNLWMPWRIVTAFLAFFVSLLPLQRGNLNYLFPAVLFSCILIHGYASMPLFTLPFLLIAFLMGLKKQDNIRQYKLIFIFSFFTALLFASPILIDHYLNNPSNLNQMLLVNAEMQSKKHPELNKIIDELFYRFTHKGSSFEPLFWDYTFLLPFLMMGILFLSKSKTTIPWRDFFKSFKPLFLWVISIYALSIFYFWRFTFDPGFAPFLIYSAYYLNIFPPILYASLLTPFYFLTDGKIKLKSLWILIALILIALIRLKIGLPSVRTNHQIELISNEIAQIAQNEPVSIRLDYLPAAYIQNHLVYSFLFKEIILPADQAPKNWATQDRGFNDELTWIILGILENLNQKNILLCVDNHLSLSVPMFTPKHICTKNTKPLLVLTQAQECHFYKKCLLTTERFGLAQL